MDELEVRILQLAKEEREAAERPQLDGRAVMEQLNLSGGPAVGQALNFLLEIKRTEGVLPEEELRAKLDAWWAEHPASQS